MEGRRKSKHIEAFTLIELMAVIVIIGLLTTVAVLNYPRFVNRGRMAARDTTMQMIRTAITQYTEENKSKPPESLEELVRGSDPFIQEKTYDELMEDPWGNQYHYQVTGKKWSLTCYGQDGAPGGEGFDEDVTIPRKTDDSF